MRITKSWFREASIFSIKELKISNLSTELIEACEHRYDGYTSDDRKGSLILAIFAAISSAISPRVNYGRFKSLRNRQYFTWPGI